MPRPSQCSREASARAEQLAVGRGVPGRLEQLPGPVEQPHRESAPGGGLEEIVHADQGAVRRAPPYGGPRDDPARPAHLARRAGRALDAVGYLADEGLATAAFLALRMHRPLFCEGDAGVGKTALAAALADAAGRPADPAAVLRGAGRRAGALRLGLPAPAAAPARRRGRRRGRRRPAGARALRPPVPGRPAAAAGAGDGHRGGRAVLLVDEVDRADDEFEAFLLEVLSDWTISVPELGTIRAEVPPVVVVTSNRTREVHDALKRRCLYHWLAHPDVDREVAIIRRRLPEATEALATGVARVAARRPRRGPAQAARRGRVAGLDRGAARARAPAPSARRARPRRRQPRRVREVPRGPGAGRRAAGRVGGRPGDHGCGQPGDGRRRSPAPWSASPASCAPPACRPPPTGCTRPGRRSATSTSTRPARRLLGRPAHAVRRPGRPGPLRPGVRRVLRRRAAPPLRTRAAGRRCCARSPSRAPSDRSARARPGRAAAPPRASELEVLRHRDLAAADARPSARSYAG